MACGGRLSRVTAAGAAGGESQVHCESQCYTDAGRTPRRRW